MSRLRERLLAGDRVVTVEAPIGDHADPAFVMAAVEPFAGRVDAVSTTDNAGAHAHASSLATAALIGRVAEPVMNLACRDRNRLALQAELLGAALHGIENIVCVTGDDVTAGDEPEARRVFDLDSPQLLAVASALADGSFLSGRAIEPPPRFFLGAVENPTAPPLDYRAERAAKKVRAGARFFQLQVVFEPGPVEAFLDSAAGRGLCEQAFFLPSICFLRSARQLRYLDEHVPGVSVPARLRAVVERLPQEEQASALLDHAVSLARDLLALPRASGVHVIPLGGPELVVELLDRIGTAVTPPEALRGDSALVPH